MIPSVIVMRFFPEIYPGISTGIPSKILQRFFQQFHKFFFRTYSRNSSKRVSRGSSINSCNIFSSDDFGIVFRNFSRKSSRGVLKIPESRSRDSSQYCTRVYLRKRLKIFSKISIRILSEITPQFHLEISTVILSEQPPRFS